MFSRYFALVFLLSATASACAADYKVGPKGGVYCKSADDLMNQIASAMKGSHETVPGCGMLMPGTSIATATINRAGGIVGGTGTSASILGGGEFAFTTVDDSDTKPEPAKPVKAKLPATDPSRTYKVVGPEDVEATPAKWVGRDLSFQNVQVYWVGDDDVRFLTRAMLTVFGTKVLGSSKDIDYLKNNCETSKEASSSKCRATIHFSYTAFDVDHPTPTLTRLVISTDDVAVARH